MEKYKCIDDFSVELTDDDGFFTNKYKIIEKNSIWKVSESDFRLVGGDIRLETTGKGLWWIEICKERLLDHFELVTTKEE